MASSKIQAFAALSAGALAYYLVAKLCMALFSFHPSNITLLWLPFGIGVILVHRFGALALPFIFISSYTANYEGMVNEAVNYHMHIAVAALADTLAPYLASYLIKRYVEENCDSVKVLIPFSLYGALIPTFASSLVLALNLFIGNYIHKDDISLYIITLMFADGMGLFLLFPVYKHMHTLTLPTHKEWKRIILYGGLAAILILYSFQYHYFIFAVLPLLLIAAFRIRIHYVMILLLGIIIEFISLSTMTSNPIFKMETQEESILTLMAYCISLAFVVVGIALHHRELITNIRLAYTDNLTQTKNLKAYKEEINKLILHYQRYQTVFSAILLDIDDFKMINDTYGHRVGDIVLTELCALIQKNIRESDTLFRVGGEEFLILFPNTPLDKAKEIAHKLSDVVANKLNTIEDRPITISIGASAIALLDSEDSLYRRIDDLLYQSKHGGKNRVSAA